MFKFEEYPTINEAHKKYRKLERKFVNLQIKYDKSGSEKGSKKFDEAIRDAQLFGDIEYGKIVFDVFKAIKPDIKDKKEGTIYKWDELYGQDFEQLSPTLKKALSMMVEEERPYILPEKYYDNRPLY